MPPQQPPPPGPFPATMAGVLVLCVALLLKKFESVRVVCCPLQFGQAMGSSAFAIVRS